VLVFACAPLRALWGAGGGEYGTLEIAPQFLPYGKDKDFSPKSIFAFSFFFSFLFSMSHFPAVPRPVPSELWWTYLGGKKILLGL
jgi:hypothetical protein